jgi:hypothetical protein
MIESPPPTPPIAAILRRAAARVKGAEPGGSMPMRRVRSRRLSGKRSIMVSPLFTRSTRAGVRLEGFDGLMPSGADHAAVATSMTRHRPANSDGVARLFVSATRPPAPEPSAATRGAASLEPRASRASRSSCGAVARFAVPSCLGGSAARSGSFLGLGAGFNASGVKRGAVPWSSACFGGSAATFTRETKRLRIGPDDDEVEPPLRSDDSLRNEPSHHYQVVMTNPPFGKKSSITVVNEEGCEAEHAHESRSGRVRDLLYGRGAAQAKGDVVGEDPR